MLFRKDMTGVYLAITQGVSELKKQYSSKSTKNELEKKARELHEYFEASDNKEFKLDGEIRLQEDKDLGKLYEAATVAYKLYEKDAIPNDDIIERDIDYLLNIYDRYLDSKNLSKSDQMREDIFAHLASSGLHFPDTLVTAYLLALKTKPFVILTGITGTGKTKLAQEVAEYYSKGDPSRWAFVPVRPDWSDNQGLLGFYNLITQRYEPTELLKLILRAADDLENPYFLILDEMNLAKVEYYFSDFLSCLESGEPILLHDQPEDLPFSDGEREYLIPSRLNIPENLFITGTVNVDETTYMFSPKVLDRAFTLEFDQVDAPAYLGLESALPPDGLRLSSDFTLLPREQASKQHAEGLSKQTRELLVKLEELLALYHLHFGYRVINEISLYLANARAFVGEDSLTEQTAFDLCLLSKVFPKLHGNRGELEEPLARLLFFCFGLEAPKDPAEHFNDFEAGDPPLYKPDKKDPRFPRAATKVHRMWSVLRTRGFVSFVE